jgi:hypothetical protein
MHKSIAEGIKNRKKEKRPKRPEILKQTSVFRKSSCLGC